MPLTPDQVRVLEAMADELTATAPELARRLSTPSRPARPGRTQIAGFLVLLVWTAVGLAPLAVGLRLDLGWLAGIGAVTTCALPFAGVWATFPTLPALPRPAPRRRMTSTTP